MCQGCLENLTPLLYYPTWTTDGGRGALSNNILASAPQHPFWILLTDSLIPYNWNYFFPYVTISYASGQWFETAIWEAYHAMLQKPRLRGSKDHKEFQGHLQSGAADGGDGGEGGQGEEQEEEGRLYRIMMDDRPGTDPWIYFTHQGGGTWVNWDNALFLWIGDHLILIGVGVCVLLGAVWWGVRTCVRRKSVKRDGYRRVGHDV
jgi:inositol phosphorylceramide mannosyltransferase catalytic subunit